MCSLAPHIWGYANYLHQGLKAARATPYLWGYAVFYPPTDDNISAPPVPAGYTLPSLGPEPPNSSMVPPQVDYRTYL